MQKLSDPYGTNLLDAGGKVVGLLHAEYVDLPEVCTQLLLEPPFLNQVYLIDTFFTLILPVSLNSLSLF